MNNSKNSIQPTISTEQSNAVNPLLKPAGFFRRMAAIIYDGILVFSILFFSSIPILVLFEKFTGEKLNEHSAYYGFVLWLYCAVFIYFGWFWTKTGQTPGMKAWRLKLANLDGLKINWTTALRRYLGALLSWAIAGLGFLWVLISKKTLHGMLSKTRVYLDK